MNKNIAYEDKIDQLKLKLKKLKNSNESFYNKNSKKLLEKKEHNTDTLINKIDRLKLKLKNIKLENQINNENLKKSLEE